MGGEGNPEYNPNPVKNNQYVRHQHGETKTQILVTVYFDSMQKGQGQE